MVNLPQQQSCSIFVENRVEQVPKVQSTVIIAYYSALHLDGIT